MSEKEKEKILQKTQAGIFKSHGRKNVRFLFIEFKTEEIKLINKEETEFIIINKWLNLLEITSASEQSRDTFSFKNKKDHKEKVIVNFYLSPFGIKYLIDRNNKTDDLGSFPSTGITFWDGMAKNRDDLGDPCEKHWEKNYQGEKIHVLVTIASNDEVLLDERQKSITDSLENIGIVKFHEYGKRMFNKDEDGKNIEDEPIEPFGYRDSLTKVEFKEIMDLVLLGDGDKPKEKDGDSLFVFRKLKQDVKEFKKATETLATNLGISLDFAEGQIMGRFKNGNPILLSPTSKDLILPSDLKDFNEGKIKYNNDAHGLKCPIHAHIRTVNNRDSEAPEQIIRRSIPYDYSDENKGLLFMCFQKNIKVQFIATQKWANNDHNYPDSKFDYVAGQGDERLKQKWIKEWGQSENEEFDFGQFVHFQGGEYFYVPSMNFFDENLSLEDKLKILTSSSKLRE